ncbi:MAG TPA: hydroxysqualene dehydroxylase HpnE [Bacteroidota bacterium]
MNPVVIVGGGLSGLAAAVHLSSRRIPVLLLEQRKFLGGRAYSFVDDSTGTVIDNGQHVLIAGYTHTMEFLGRIGTRDRLAVQGDPELVFHHPERGFCTFRLPLLPSPLHLLGGIITTDLFSPRDKIRMLRAGGALRSFRTEAVGGMTIEAWLDSIGQSAETKRSFWEPLAVAIMNERIGVASAVVFIRALRTAFLSGRRGTALAIPTVGLSDLYVGPARAFIERQGGVLRCGADVTGSVVDGENVAGVRLKEGEMIGCSALILAVPSYRAPSLLPAALRTTGFMAPAASIPLSPIVSVHLWFEEEVMPQVTLGVIGRRVQWVFNRRKICPENEKERGGHLSAVISAAHAFVEMGNDDLTRIVLEDLESIYGPNAGRATHAVVIREKRGTFSCTPEVERIRPGCETPVPNLFIAGDWTDTGYPATIEGAIISGERCAGRVMALLAGGK